MGVRGVFKDISEVFLVSSPVLQAVAFTTAVHPSLSAALILSPEKPKTLAERRYLKPYRFSV